MVFVKTNEMTIRSSKFGSVHSQDIWQFSITAKSGAFISLITYGARINSVRMPDREGQLDEITIGYDNLESYLHDPAYLGATVGRFANRIRDGQFTLDHRQYQLPRNEGAHHLHGGPGGFHQVLWDADPYQDDDRAGLRFFRISADGEEGYPGRLEVQVDISLTENAVLQFEYKASCDRATPVNLTNHTYWNLGGGVYIGEHYLRLSADRVLAVDTGMLPTGEQTALDGIPLDFRQWKLLDAGIRPFTGTHIGGVDHCFVLHHHDDKTLNSAADLYSPSTGRLMQIATSMPAIQVYSANRAEGLPSRTGSPLPVHNSVCLETQFFPDSPNVPGFHAPILHPGEEYLHHTQHCFIASDPFLNKKTEA